MHHATQPTEISHRVMQRKLQRLCLGLPLARVTQYAHPDGFLRLHRR
ncbi:hypothetical protein ACQEVY_12800 [Streptomyces sp. CA-288835]